MRRARCTRATPLPRSASRAACRCARPLAVSRREPPPRPQDVPLRPCLPRTAGAADRHPARPRLRGARAAATQLALALALASTDFAALVSCMLASREPACRRDPEGVGGWLLVLCGQFAPSHPPPF